jgi:Acetyltransferase (GNAT) domain
MFPRISEKAHGLREAVEARLAGKEAGIFGDVKNPKWASTTMGNYRISDSPQSRKTPLLYLPSASYGPLRFVLHQNILSDIGDNYHRIIAVNRNGKIKGEIVFNCGKDVVSIDALNTARPKTGMGRSLVLLLAKNIPQGKKNITVLAAHSAIPFYERLGFRRIADSQRGGCLMACHPDELFMHADEVAKTGARKGNVFVR